ncbi:restriction endonuclease subunit S [Aeromonas veronii]|uniref:restriction endonuclease subunit S n=1 Tax=Aeromonas veronii TaxID=654 RepID=UPI0009BF9F88|nr:restriction endonuclease subunit S [Aeromonas veronii]
MRSDWAEVQTIGELLAREGGSIKTGPFGTALKASEYADVGVPLISVREIGHGTFHIDRKTPRICNATLARLPEYILQEGDIVFARKGGIERCALIRKPQSGWFLGSDGIRLRPPAACDARFIAYSLQTNAVKDWLLQNSTGSTMASLNQATIGRLPIALPAIGEQKRIADVLEAFDDRITLLRETNATLEAIAQALFKSWFVDFDPVHARARGEQPPGLAPEVAALFPDSFEESELGMIPKGWNTGTLGDVAHFQNGYAFKSKDWCESGHPVVKIGDVKSGIIDFSGCSYIAPETTEGLSRFKLRRGDLLVGMTGYVGETGLVPYVEQHAYLNQRVGRIATKSGLIELGFVYCLVRNSAFKGYAEARSHGSAQANVSGAVLLDYPVVTPTQSILDRFNGSVGVLLERILSNHEQAQTLANLRDTLLPRLISGQLRLPDAEQQLKDLAV